MPNRAIREGAGSGETKKITPAPSGPSVKPVAKASIVGATPPPPAPAVCPKCKGSKKVLFTEPKRKLKSSGPCPDCVKA